MKKFKPNDRFGVAGVVTRVLLSLFIVFATYNPSGRSYLHWALSEGDVMPRILVGLVLVGIYVSLLYATWEVIGFTGMFLVAAICLGFAWWLEILGLVDLSHDATFGLTLCVTVAMVIAWGMSFSFLFARLTGILHTRGTIH